MAIIRPSLVKRSDSEGARVLQSPSLQEAEEIPFVPAFDLLEQLESRLSDEVVGAVACALFALLPQPETSPTAWAIQARLEGVSQREL